MKGKKRTGKLLEEIMTENWSDYVDVRKKQTLKQKLRLIIETFYSDKRINPVIRCN